MERHSPQNEHPPLARDPQGNLLAVPDGTCAWRVCRHTKGRPRIVNGPDKQPVRFPLDTTTEDLVDACGADTYRLYALDDVGNVIDYVTTFEAGRELRNATDLEATLAPASRPISSGTDLRYALEAVTHIARVNAEAMRAVAESQADWIKSISSARGFFRNAPPLQLQAPAEEPRPEDDDEEDEPRADWVEVLQPVIGAVVQQVMTAVMSRKADPSDRPKWELAGLLDWRRVEKKRDEAQKLPAGEGSGLQQALIGKAMAVAALLEPDERARLMRIAPMFSKLAADPEIARITAEVVAMSTEDAAAWARAHLDEIEKGLAS